MAELDTQKREKLDKRTFAYVDSRGEGHLPLNDESHIRNAMARFNQTAFESPTAKQRAGRKIRAAARKHGIEVSSDDNVAKPSRSLRAVRTRRGMKGGRKVVRPKRKTTTAQRKAARSNVRKAQRARRRAA